MSHFPYCVELFSSVPARGFSPLECDLDELLEPPTRSGITRVRILSQ